MTCDVFGDYAHRASKQVFFFSIHVGQVLLNGCVQVSGALIWMMWYVDVNAFLATHILFIIQKII